jgi:hypothetical protein
VRILKVEPAMLKRSDFCRIFWGRSNGLIDAGNYNGVCALVFCPKSF